MTTASDRDLSFKGITFDWLVAEEADSGEGVFEGYGSIYGVVDLQGEVVQAGAFRKSLREKSRFPFLWQHDSTQPIGVVEAVEDERGLRIKGRLSLGVQRAKDCFALMKDRALTGFSVGFQVKRDRWENGVRHLIECSLWEVSAVTFPACPAAQLVAVKHARAGADAHEVDPATLPAEAVEHAQRCAAWAAARYNLPVPTLRWVSRFDDDPRIAAQVRKAVPGTIFLRDCLCAAPDSERFSTLIHELAHLRDWRDRDAGLAVDTNGDNLFDPADLERRAEVAEVAARVDLRQEVREAYFGSYRKFYAGLEQEQLARRRENR